MAAALGVNYESIKGNITYYDFRYPEANGMTMLVERVAGRGSNSFSLLIPSTKTLYNASFAHFVNGNDGSLTVDGTLASNIYDPYAGVTSYRFYNASLFKTNILHTVGISSTLYASGSSGASTVLIYGDNGTI